MASLAMEMGLIRALHTGDLFKDTLLSLAIPTILKQITWAIDGSGHDVATLVEDLQDKLQASWRGRGVERQVAMSEFYGNYGGLEDMVNMRALARQAWLQRAVTVYIANHVDLDVQQRARFQLMESEVNADEGNSSDEINLDAFFVGLLPPLNEWIQLEDGVEVKRVEWTERVAHSRHVRRAQTAFRFRLQPHVSPRRMNEIINTAYEEYLALDNTEESVAQKARHIYVRKCSVYGLSSTENDADKKHAAVRYKLSDETSFKNLFFRQKKSVLKLVEDFQHHRGKFAIPGFPYKLGLLLHGPSGCGKTSLIKALAAHTQRDIVTISLNKIKTNQQLMREMFNLRFHLADEERRVNLPIDKVIFVIEDLDMIPDVIKQRDVKHNGSSTPASSDTSSNPATENTTASDTATAITADLNTQTQERMNALLEQMLANCTIKRPQVDDQLNLSGLLNVLDGVVDSPGRIVVMVTENPDRLDPALIRPGRVNKILELSMMTREDMVDMIEYYYDTKLTSTQLDHVRSSTVALTPAEMESFCLVEESAEALLSRHL